MGQRLQKFRDFQIAGTEILSPLGDAVGLIHRQKIDGQLPGQRQKPLSQQPLRGNIDDFVPALPQVSVHQPQLLPSQRAVDVGGRNAGTFQRHHLIAHQGDQGRHHQRDSRQQQSRDLIAQAFPSAGGHDAEDIPTSQLGIDERLLRPPELGITKDLMENFQLSIQNKCPLLCP